MSGVSRGRRETSVARGAGGSGRGTGEVSEVARGGGGRDGLDHTRAHSKTLASPLSQMGAEPGEWLSRGVRTGSDLILKVSFA